jgi:hypothetical protein
MTKLLNNVIKGRNIKQPRLRRRRRLSRQDSKNNNKRELVFLDDHNQTFAQDLSKDRPYDGADSRIIRGFFKNLTEDEIESVVDFDRYVRPIRDWSEEIWEKWTDWLAVNGDNYLVGWLFFPDKDAYYGIDEYVLQRFVYSSEDFVRESVFTPSGYLLPIDKWSDDIKKQWKKWLVDTTDLVGKNIKKERIRLGISMTNSQYNLSVREMRAQWENRTAHLHYHLPEISDYQDYLERKIKEEELEKETI